MKELWLALRNIAVEWVANRIGRASCKCYYGNHYEMSERKHITGMGSCCRVMCGPKQIRSFEDSIKYHQHDNGRWSRVKPGFRGGVKYVDAK